MSEITPVHPDQLDDTTRQARRLTSVSVQPSTQTGAVILRLAHQGRLAKEPTWESYVLPPVGLLQVARHLNEEFEKLVQA